MRDFGRATGVIALNTVRELVRSKLLYNLLLFAALAWRGFGIARAAATDRSRLLAFSLTALLAIQAAWICGAMVRVFPFSGINLPFVSTGLSNAIASAVAVGTLLNLSRRAPANDTRCPWSSS